MPRLTEIAKFMVREPKTPKVYSGLVTKLRERDIEDYLVKRVKSMGGEVRKVKWIGRKSAPDRVVMWRGRTPRVVNGAVVETPPTIWVELKAPGKSATPAQYREHARMRTQGQHVVVIDSFKDVDALLA